MSETTKRYIVSSTVTFISAFSLYFITVIDDITIETVSSGAIISMIFVGIRAGIKALLESFIHWEQNENK